MSKISRDPICVTDSSARSDNDAREGHFARVVDGEHTGRYGVFEHVTQYGSDGYPVVVAFKTRDDRAELLFVDYVDLRPALPGGR